MSFIAFTILGLIVSAIARRIVPGARREGCITSILLGIVGANLGGWIGSRVFGTDLGQFFELRTWLLALLGTAILVFVWRLIWGRLR
ncbi:GlsB/YeaQ/YmgE family stress response membrane protein [Micrococcales bacterium 31B]|nr:GlsB/YeaQ/YmgE family stress response membrane protein [Micrococcales bacterium 31B]